MKAAAIGLGLIFTSGLAFGAEQKLSIPQRPKPAALNLTRMIDVIATLENGKWEDPGGRLCFTVSAWYELTNLPYKLASHEPTAKRMAAKRLSEAAETCVRFSIEPTPRLLIGSWFRGLSGAMKDEKRGKPHDYAVRGNNLYSDSSFK